MIIEDDSPRKMAFYGAYGVFRYQNGNHFKKNPSDETRILKYLNR